MYKLSLLVSLLGLAACRGTPPASPDAAPAAGGPAVALTKGFESWAGVYDGSWVNDGPTAAGLVTPVVGYKVVVKPAGARFEVEVEADGYQTRAHMAGGGEPSADGRELVVRFVACRAEDVFECNGYAKGDEILSLRREGQSVWLRFGKLSAPDNELREIKVEKSKG